MIPPRDMGWWCFEGGAPSKVAVLMVGSSVGRKLSLKIVEILEEDGMKIFIIYKMKKAGT